MDRKFVFPIKICHSSKKIFDKDSTNSLLNLISSPTLKNKDLLCIPFSPNYKYAYLLFKHYQKLNSATTVAFLY